MAEAKPIPVFKLYGEQTAWLTPDLLHCEAIADRSRLHDWVIKPHRHRGLYQLLYLNAGDAVLQQDAQQYHLEAGSLVIVPEMSIHGFAFGPKAAGYVLTLAHPLVHRLAQSLPELHAFFSEFVRHRISVSQRRSDIERLLEIINQEYQRDGLGRQVLLESLLSSLFVWLLRQARPQDTHDTPATQDHFGRFTDLIEAHFREPRGVADYANDIGITANHLNAVCRQAVNKPALALIHERQILEAKRRLVYSALTINQIADELGFSDPAYFSRFFKRLTGSTPKGFRTQAGT
ncbi:helix-turn-helix domain-containing protein [Saccharospirillum alexandrii]|uniref:helix-turn-helix domain-containing protein n=1 Tax=Saccharospirillum alexandrii TaxID=2448477 RepID=UPI001722074E